MTFIAKFYAIFSHSSSEKYQLSPHFSQNAQVKTLPKTAEYAGFSSAIFYRLRIFYLNVKLSLIMDAP